MKMQLFDMKKERGRALIEAENIQVSALVAHRDMTQGEQLQHDAATEKATALGNQIAALENSPDRTLAKMFRGNPGAVFGAGDPAHTTRSSQKPMSEEYTADFLSFVRSGGKHTPSSLAEGFDPMFGGFALPALPGMSAALYEGTSGGSTTSGGYAVSIPTDGQIVPLALPDIGVRSVARVIPTATDVKVPGQTSFGTAGWKNESGASSNLFSESDPALAQFTLSAFMTGLTHTVSWELLQDVSMFQEFSVGDLLNAVDINEDNAFVNGTGSGQPLGLIGNTATGTGAPYLVESTGAYLLNATDDILGTLKGSYFPNAAWLMSRLTATAIRKAQRQANLFAPVFTRENGRDLLHGFPVSYSSSMPALPTATTAGVVPMLFGSFKDGYVIGDRGGSGTFVKVLDQPLATAGQTVLLAYKRVDGRVRRSEAIQSITISHS
jgi:HK97 family phage major capsid protein